MFTLQVKSQDIFRLNERGYIMALTFTAQITITTFLRPSLMRNMVGSRFFITNLITLIEPIEKYLKSADNFQRSNFAAI